MNPKNELRCPVCNTLILKYGQNTVCNIEVMCRKCKTVIPFIKSN